MQIINSNQQILIYCATFYGEETYLKLHALNCNIVGFCDNSAKRQNTLLWGLEVHDYSTCRMKWPDAVYVIANLAYATSLEIGEELEEDGYIKNQSYYIMNELELLGNIPSAKEGFLALIDKKSFVLHGNPLLCSMFKNWAVQLCPDVELYICESELNIREYLQKDRDAVWIHLEEREWADVKILQKLYNYGVPISRFFMYHMFYAEETDGISACDSHYPDIKKVLFLKSSSHAGCTFVNSIIDAHPNVLYLGFNIWSVNVLLIVKAAVRSVSYNYSNTIVEEIMRYAKYYEIDHEVSVWLGDYREILDRYLETDKVYSERDLFIIVHLAYYELLHKTSPIGKELLIYMDIHANSDVMSEGILSWLDTLGFEITLLEIVRHPYKRLGSAIRFTIGRLKLPIVPAWVLQMLDMMSGEHDNEMERKYPHIRIRFEDLKMHPKYVLMKLCERCSIPWDDILLSTTDCGQISSYDINDEIITGFDLKPVYHVYDEYFDAFDKLRLDMIFCEKNKAYGYSYVPVEKYPATLFEIEELFKIPFRLEQFMQFKDEKDRERFHNRMQLLCMQLIYMQNHKEYAGYFQFGEYITLEGSECGREQYTG